MEKRGTPLAYMILKIITMPHTLPQSGSIRGGKYLHLSIIQVQRSVALKMSFEIGLTMSVYTNAIGPSYC